MVDDKSKCETLIDILKSRSSHPLHSVLSKWSLGMKEGNDFYVCSTNQTLAVVQLPISYSPSNRADRAPWQIQLRKNGLFIYNDTVSQAQDLSLKTELTDREDKQVFHVLHILALKPNSSDKELS